MFPFIELIDKHPRVIRTGREIPQASNGKLLTTSLWVNNNSLTSLHRIAQAIKDVFEYPLKMQWIDFSFNNIEEIDEVCLQMILSYFLLYFKIEC
jgi:hypothetical protein